MSAWNEQNTDGFNAKEMAMLSNAHSRLANEFPDIDKTNLNDLLNNEWYQGITEDEIVNAVQKRLR